MLRKLVVLSIVIAILATSSTALAGGHRWGGHHGGSNIGTSCLVGGIGALLGYGLAKATEPPTQIVVQSPQGVYYPPARCFEMVTPGYRDAWGRFIQAGPSYQVEIPCR